MIYLGDQYAFWGFSFILVGFLTIAIIAARLISAKNPNRIKNTTYECGQDPFSDVKEFKILGIIRYFGYAVIFFALDAFAWVVLSAAISINLNLSSIIFVSFYIFIVLTGIAYFLIELKKMVI